MELTRKQKAFVQREQDIIEAALSLLSTNDCQAVTVEQIAKKAEIGKGTVYKHFASKEDIYAQITLNHCQVPFELMQHPDLSKGILHGLQQIIEQSLLNAINNPVSAKVTHFCHSSEFKARLTPKFVQAFDDFDKECHEMIVKLLRAGIEQKELPEQPIEELVLAMHTCFHGVLAMIWDGLLQGFEHVKQEDFIRITSKFMIAGAIGYQGS